MGGGEGQTMYFLDGEASQRTCNFPTRTLVPYLFVCILPGTLKANTSEAKAVVVALIEGIKSTKKALSS